MKEEDSRRPATGEPAEDEGRSLSVETVQQNLGVLGKNPYTLAFVFTTATLCDLQLVDLHAIGDFPNLQHVVCSQNRLRSLAPLGDLRLLLSVDASHNALTHALDFDVPRCSDKNAWVDGAEWIGSVLRRAELSFNCITSMRDLGGCHPFLQELYLAHNDLRELCGVASLRYLRVLDVSYNRLTTTKGLVPLEVLNGSGQRADVLFLEALEVLRLSHNQITCIDDVVALPRLMELDVAHNKLTSLNCLDNCYRLQKLNVAYNELESVNQVNYLFPLPFLQTLVLTGCPLVAHEASRVIYRARVLRRLQQLVELDGERVSAKEKTKALAMHGSEIASRKHVLASFLPTEDFVNFLPPLDFEEDAELVQFYQARFEPEADHESTEE